LTIDDRIANLNAATAHGTTIEEELLRVDVIAMGAALTTSPGSSGPLLVALETRRSAFFKRFCDQNRNLCTRFGQHPFDVPLNEVVAWRLAAAMGNPWRQLLPTAVLRGAAGRMAQIVARRRQLEDGAVLARVRPRRDSS
jgi:hypothetical protein